MGAGDNGDQRLEQLLTAVNTAAGRARAAWLVVVSFAAFLAVTAGGTTHRGLLLETSVKLPLLQTDLSLIGFYTVAPSLLVLLHLNLLVLLRLLRARLDAFNRTLESVPLLMHEGVTAARQHWRLRLDTFVYVQRHSRFDHGPYLRTLLNIMLVVTVVIGPPVVLILLQVVFLPYQSTLITWLHRCSVTADICLLWTLPAGGDRTVLWWKVLPVTLREWGGFLTRSYSRVVGALRSARQSKPAGTRSFAIRYMPTKGQRWHRFAIIASILVCSVSIAVVALPDEWPWDPGRIVTNRLELYRFERTADEGSRSLRLVGRSFRKALLADADLQTVDLSRADLTNAVLRNANLKNASLRRATLNGALLQNATLTGVNLSGATLTGANLQDVDLVGAVLSDAVLTDSFLRGATLTGANLSNATLTGANLEGATLTGANLFNATLTGVNLELATLTGANLRRAKLTGAQLSNADLTDSVLSGTILTGAVLHDTSLSGADLRGASVWRSRFSYFDRSANDQKWIDGRGITVDSLEVTDYEALLADVRKQLMGSGALPDVEQFIRHLKPDPNSGAIPADWRTSWDALTARDWSAAKRDVVTRRLIVRACEGPNAQAFARDLLTRVEAEMVRMEGAVGDAAPPANHDPISVIAGVLACAEGIGMAPDDRAKWEALMRSAIGAKELRPKQKR